MKTILSIYQVSNKGKTETLREFANFILHSYPSFRSIFPAVAIVPPFGDFRLVVEVNGKIIGIESEGDPNSNLKNRLLDLADNFECDVILCTSRTKGKTIDAVDNLYYTRGFETIWTSTYQIENKSHHSLVNQLKAKHILDLLQSLGLLLSTKEEV